MKEKHEVMVEAGYLEVFVRELFEKAGMESRDAQFHAEALVQTDFVGNLFPWLHESSGLF